MKTLKYFFFLFFFSLFTQAQTHTLYVGTYTSGESEGVYTFDFDVQTGTFSNKKLIAKETNPSYIAFTKNKQFLYVLNEVNDFNQTETGAVNTYRLTVSGTYQKINTVSTNGAHPCHISLNASEDQLAISNYSGGNVSLHEIRNGLVQPAFQVLDQMGTTQAHAHMAQFKDNQIFTADLGRNFIAEYTANSGANYYQSKVYPMMKEAGPRHFRFTKDGNFIYVINELNSTISVLKKSSKGFNRIQNVNTLSDSYEGANSCADIQIAPDERFVYGSNRGENSIVVFKRNQETGRLNKVQTVSVQGNWPRSFIIDPTGSFLLVANERSNAITVFSISKETGKLQFSAKQQMSAPVCLLF